MSFTPKAESRSLIMSRAAVVFTHTVVPERLQGRGLASILIKAALTNVRERGLKVVAQCPFVARYIERHPEERDLLAQAT